MTKTESVPDTRDRRLSVEGLSVSLRGRAMDVVSDVSFTLESGEFLGLVGESGSGKTTTAQALLGHTRRGLEITAGAVWVGGVDLLALSPQQLRQRRGSMVAYVPQDPSTALNPALRIGAQLRETLEVHGSSQADIERRVDEVLVDVQLEGSPDLLRRYPHQLSGGQQQRVALAMAFACRPSLIVMDEPTTGLDVSTQRHVLDTVRDLCGNYGSAAVYVSHDLAVVAELVTSVAVMYSGRIIEWGPAGAVFNQPAHPYTRGLVDAVPSIESAEILRGIEGVAPRPGEVYQGCSFAPRCGHVQARCLTDEPAEVRIDSRRVRCHRVSEIQNRAIVKRPALTSQASSEAIEPRLDVDGLSAGYGDAAVLHDVSFQVPPRVCVALVGESGSGKTTLARCLAGLHRPISGSLALDGQVLGQTARERSKDDLRRLQYVFQNPYMSLNPRRTVRESIEQPVREFFDLSRAARDQRVLDVLERVGLTASSAGLFPDQLSGGQRQRVALARALAVEPEVLVCDEITSALDVSAQAMVVELLRQLQEQQQLSLVFITHNLALVRSIARDVVVLQNGRIVESGSVSSVLDHPMAPYTARLIEDIPRFEAVNPAALP